MHPDHFAIVVGVNHYANLKDLRGAHNDADAFYEWLVDPERGGLPEDNVKRITSAETHDTPTGLLVEDAVDEIVLGWKANKPPPPLDGVQLSRLYLYFAGHGTSGVSTGTTAGSRETLLLMPKYRTERPRAFPGVLCADRIANSAMFGEVVLVMDCCRDFTRARVQGSFLPDYKEDAVLAPKVKRLYAFATGEGEPAREEANGDGVVRGRFSRVLIEGLEGAAAEDGAVTSASLRKYVEGELNAARPGGGGQTAKVHDDGAIVFATTASPMVALQIERADASRPVWLFPGLPDSAVIPPASEDGATLTFELPPRAMTYFAGLTADDAEPTTWETLDSLRPIPFRGEALTLQFP